VRVAILLLNVRRGDHFFILVGAVNSIENIRKWGLLPAFSIHEFLVQIERHFHSSQYQRGFTVFFFSSSKAKTCIAVTGKTFLTAVKNTSISL